MCCRCPPFPGIPVYLVLNIIFGIFAFLSDGFYIAGPAEIQIISIDACPGFEDDDIRLQLEVDGSLQTINGNVSLNEDFDETVKVNLREIRDENPKLLQKLEQQSAKIVESEQRTEQLENSCRHFDELLNNILIFGLEVAESTNLLSYLVRQVSKLLEIELTENDISNIFHMRSEKPIPHIKIGFTRYIKNSSSAIPINTKINGDTYTVNQLMEFDNDSAIKPKKLISHSVGTPKNSFLLDENKALSLMESSKPNVGQGKGNKNFTRTDSVSGDESERATRYEQRVMK
ncbi:hypothetical protein JTB14_026004 [Gonioctena quinquepunctata]|nr:hypothetical protein JTB14_026004 [Gonioctena quinquepunctata]